MQFNFFLFLPFDWFGSSIYTSAVLTKITLNTIDHRLSICDDQVGAEFEVGFGTVGAS